MGVPQERVTVTGNMKFDAMPPAAPDARAVSVEGLRRLYGLPATGTAPVLVAGSTSPGEEEMILDAIESDALRGVVTAGGDAANGGRRGFAMILAPGYASLKTSRPRKWSACSWVR